LDILFSICDCLALRLLRRLALPYAVAAARDFIGALRGSVAESGLSAVCAAAALLRSLWLNLLFQTRI